MICIGIDIGLTGAIASVDSAGQAGVYDMPTKPDGKGNRIDGLALAQLIRRIGPATDSALVVFENVQARPQGNGGAHGNSMHSQASLMRSRGVVEAVVECLRLRFHVVSPQTWQRHFGLLLPKEAGEKAEKHSARKKAQSIALACELHPLVRGQLSRVKDHNRAEALLLAHYGMGLHA